jgi:hypothetical protein
VKKCVAMSTLEKEFREFCLERGLGEVYTESAVAAVREFEGHLGKEGKDFESA